MYLNTERLIMAIQIYGTNKSNDTKKAQRFFKERNIKFQFVDLSQNAMSEGELNSIKNGLKLSLDELVDTKSKLYEKTFFKYLANEDDKLDKLLDNQTMLIQPIIRIDKKPFMGFKPDEWKDLIK